MKKEQRTNGFQLETDDKDSVKVERRIIDMLDIQVLLAIIVFFISAWAYLYGVICGFASTEPYKERMAYICVHYLLTLVLVLCLVITYIKGKYLLNTEATRFTDREKKYIDLFIDGWVVALLLGLFILLFTDIHWALWSIVALMLLGYYMKRKNFCIFESILIMTFIVVCFPAFISLMTNITKNIEITSSYDSNQDLVTLTISPKSYDSDYYVIGLTNTILIEGEQYILDKHVIKIKDAFVYNNELTIGFVSPAAAGNFWKYGIAKILDKQIIESVSEDAKVYNIKKIIKY